MLVVVLLAALACAGAGLIGLMVGSTGQLGWPGEPMIRNVRLDRVAISSLVGALLACAGVAYQASLKNDLAEPYLLGVASGSALASYLWTWAVISGTISVGYVLTGIGQQVVSFIGAIAAVAVVMLVAGVRRIRRGAGDLSADSSAIILSGVVISTICGAAILTLSQFMRAVPGMVGVEQLLIGGIRTDISDAGFYCSLAILVAGIGYLFWHVASMNLLTLGDDQAMSMGLETRAARVWLLVVASLMASAAVALAGPIGFIGLICPHAARRLIGVDHRLLVPASAALGAVLLTLADATSRGLAGESLLGQMLPVGVITAVVGGPVFLLLLSRQGGPR